MAREQESKQFFIGLDVDRKERFAMGRFMLFDVDVYDPLTSHVYSQVRNLKVGGRYIVTGEDFRPDAVSGKIYGDTQFWWILLVYNGLLSFNDIQHGQEIQYPSIQALEDLYFRLKVQQNKVDKD